MSACTPGTSRERRRQMAGSGTPWGRLRINRVALTWLWEAPCRPRIPQLSRYYCRKKTLRAFDQA